MDWYLILLIVLLSLGGVICGIVICLHIFECSILYKQKHSTDYGMSVDFDISQDSGNSVGVREYQPQMVTLMPLQTSQQDKSTTSAQSAFTASPGLNSNWSPETVASSKFSTSELLPASPRPAQTRQTPRMHIQLPGRERRVRDRDVEKQDTHVGNAMKNLGW